MTIEPEILFSIVEMIWSGSFGFRVEATPRTEVPMGAVTAVVTIDGEWAGTVAVRTSSELALWAATSMFGRPAPELTRQDVEEAVAEVANMTGGNLKACLPGPSRLSLPRVLDTQHYCPPGEAQVADAHFLVEGGWLAVTVFARQTAGSAAA
ncbi:MAG TPA: chemotaxis protein CheX [Gemmatimonadales bacterium]|nr:chemotaxis protein CheX [Gemmatimonadales bacterium]